MKTTSLSPVPVRGLLAAASVTLAAILTPGSVWAQAAGNNTNADANAVAQQQQAAQAMAISQQANQLLANPAQLFSQLDVDNDGLLNLNEFAQISALSTAPLVVPGTVVDPVQNPNQNPAQVTPGNTFTPPTGVQPVNGRNGPFTPATGVQPANRRGGVYSPPTGTPIPNSRPPIPTRGQ